jgi:hypothetical protein
MMRCGTLMGGGRWWAQITRSGGQRTGATEKVDPGQEVLGHVVRLGRRVCEGRDHEDAVPEHTLGEDAAALRDEPPTTFGVRGELELALRVQVLEVVPVSPLRVSDGPASARGGQLSGPPQSISR